MSVIFFYQIAIRLFTWILPVLALFNAKTKLFVAGRKNIFSKLKTTIGDSEQVIWFHCASLGEFEQVRPLIDRFKFENTSIHALKSRSAQHKILITFFSPSGYELRKNFEGADFVFYLPVDTKTNVKKFVDIVNPKLVFFVKYDFWYNYLHLLSDKRIPVYLVSANFRREQFSGLYGIYLRKVLTFFNKIFVQNVESKELLKQKGISNVEVSGDLRFDRVAQTAISAKKLTLIEYFKGTHKLLVGGSTWEAEEKLLTHIKYQVSGVKLLIAPHEVQAGHIQAVLSKFPNALLYSQISKEPVSTALPKLQSAQVLIVDTVGLLSTIYRYADVAFVGGGFGAGIHNILEATAFGVPTVFGTNHYKFPEAKELIDIGAAFSISNENDLNIVLDSLLFNDEKMKSIFTLNKNFVQNRAGATGKIMKAISE